MKPLQPALVVVAAFSQFREALKWARHRLAECWGPIALAGDPFDFHHTSYYSPTMGPNLLKQLFAFENLAAPDTLAQFKRQALELEAQIRASGEFDAPRPLNLDPGLLTLGKFMLATTKDQMHRVYLRDGIFAEVTLFFRDGEYHPWPWTYADYREESVRAFLKQARDFYKQRLTSAWLGRPPG